MKRLIVLSILIACASCVSIQTRTDTPENSQDPLIISTLWYQKSAEMRALYYQCFHNAKTALNENLAKSDKTKPGAVVLDIDETVLDNSPYQGWQINNMTGFNNEDWNRWVKMAKASALPGALEFTQFADSIGVAVFYISNRTADLTDPTIVNLDSLGFPGADTTHILLKEKSSSKTERRERVEKDYELLLLIGDNLADMTGDYERRDDDNGFRLVDTEKNCFGTKYIILPNPMYGTWLNELMKRAVGATEREKLVYQLKGF